MVDSGPPQDEHGNAPGEAPLDLDQMLALVEEQRRAVAATHLRPLVPLYSIWALAWFVGYLMLWSGFDGGNPWFRINTPIAAWTFAILIGASVLASIVISARIGRGVRGVSSFQGSVYGWGWGGLFISLGALGTAISMQADPAISALYFPSAYAIMAGAMYLFGAAVWRDQGQLILGIVLLAAGAIAPFLGTPTNYLVMAGAGLTFGVMAVLTVRGLRNTTSSPQPGPRPAVRDE